MEIKMNNKSVSLSDLGFKFTHENGSVEMYSEGGMIRVHVSRNHAEKQAFEYLTYVLTVKRVGTIDLDNEEMKFLHTYAPVFAILEMPEKAEDIAKYILSLLPSIVGE